MLGVIANQVAASIDNANMYRRHGRDGDHRRARPRADQPPDLPGPLSSLMLERNARLGRKCTLHPHRHRTLQEGERQFRAPDGRSGAQAHGCACSTANVRKIDIVARYGGEEFAIVLEETDAEGALKLAERHPPGRPPRPELHGRKGPRSGHHPRWGSRSSPDDATDKAGLIAPRRSSAVRRKHAGRNRARAGLAKAARRLARRGSAPCYR